MANREENIKKINDALEQLSDEELDQVAGGNKTQTSDDSYFLKRIGYMNDTWRTATLVGWWVSGSKAVDDGWSQAGIMSVTHPWDDNEYFDKQNGNKRLTRKEAYTLALERRGYNGPGIRDFNFDKYGL